MMEVVVTAGAIVHVRSSSQIITTNKPTPSVLQAGCPTNDVRALNGKNSHSKDLLIPSSSGGLLTLFDHW